MKMVVRKNRLNVVVKKGPYKGTKICLLKRGFSGWHCLSKNNRVDYVFNDEI